MMNSSLFRHFSGAALAAFALALPAVSRAQTTYTITDLGTLGGTFSAGYAINASGQVAGYATTSGDAATHAVRWTGTTIEDLGALGGTNSAGYAINDGGQTAGEAVMTGGALIHAVRWTGTSATDLGTLGGQGSWGYGINATGQVAGYSYGPYNLFSHAVRWTGTTVTDLGTLGGTNSSASAINDSGQVAGQSDTTTANVSHAVRWTGTTATDLGTLGGANSVGRAINATGQVAGESYLSDNNTYHAVRWTGMTITDLGSLGGSGSSAYAINRSGAVVGFSYTANGSSHAFYAPGNTMLDLNALISTNSGWTLTRANAINDKGFITGTGTINGQVHAYLLTPNTATVTGYVALEGVGSLPHISSYAPLGLFHISVRLPGATTEIASDDVILLPTQSGLIGSFTAPNLPQGVYDIGIKGAKNLRVVLPNVTITPGASLPLAMLPAGDANNDNSVDSTDFGILIGAFNTNASIPGSGYDSTADFNFDGRVDSADFGLLIGEFNNAGAP